MEFNKQVNWINCGEYIYLQGSLDVKSKVIGFDLDGTLISYKDGLDPARYPSDPNNWQFLGEIKQKILELNREYTIFIITNQFNFTVEKLKMIENVYRCLDSIPHILIAHLKNSYRKPSPSFISVISNIIKSNGKEFDHINSYYCGDAVGSDDPFPPYRWKSTDYDFSIAIGFNFIRPLDLFPAFSFNPRQEITDPSTNIKSFVNKYQLIIMMGMPGSGKSTYAKALEYYCGYCRFSQDEYGGDLEKHQQTIIQTLMSGKYVVLDATFSSFQKRIIWLRIGKELGLAMAIVWAIRDGRPFNKLRDKPVSGFAYHGKYGYNKNFNDPEERPLSIEYDIIKMW
uniref:Uncharacterized protein n=1 Tax=viral metagenome TaxID=1070528 RepID=A0A6C0BDY5_9ZZZZ